MEFCIVLKKKDFGDIYRIGLENMFLEGENDV